MIHLKKSKIATQTIFLVCGISLAAWAPMVPLVKDRLRLNDSEMGILLLFLGAGAIVIMPISGWLIPRVGSRKVVMFSAILSTVVLGCLLQVESRWLMALCLFLFGTGLGAMDVSMNSHGLLVQQLYQKPIMSSLHGQYSVGGIIGPLLIIGLTSLGISPAVCLLAVSILLMLTVLIQFRHLLDRDQEKDVSGQSSKLEQDNPKGERAWKNSAVWFLGTMCFIVFLAEGAMLDWSAIFLRDYKGTAESLAGLGYAAFSVAMAVMRLLGDRLVARIPGDKLVIAGSLLAAVGLLIAVFTPWLVTVLLGFILVGLGAANIVPIFFSESGRVAGVTATAALAAVSTMGYTGQLIGPALLGFIAEHTTLSVALIFTAVLLIAVAVSYLVRNRVSIRR